LDIGDFNRHRLLWQEFGHQQLWPKTATIVGIEPTMSMKPLWAFFFFFQQERIGGRWYLLVNETMAMWHVILIKRETHVSMEREIARVQDEKMWKDEKTQ
jgi:hypothetical protein